MAFQFMTFLTSKVVAEQAGADSQRATQLALVTGLLDMGLVPSVLIARAMAQREAPAPVAAPPQVLNPVPRVVGRSLEEAIRVLKGAGFESAEAEQLSSRPKGEIIAQDPAADALAPEGSTVQITVSLGQPEQPAAGDGPSASRAGAAASRSRRPQPETEQVAQAAPTAQTAQTDATAQTAQTRRS